MCCLHKLYLVLNAYHQRIRGQGLSFVFTFSRWFCSCVKEVFITFFGDLCEKKDWYLIKMCLRKFFDTEDRNQSSIINQGHSKRNPLCTKVCVIDVCIAFLSLLNYFYVSTNAHCSCFKKKRVKNSAGICQGQKNNIFCNSIHTNESAKKVTFDQMKKFILEFWGKQSLKLIVSLLYFIWFPFFRFFIFFHITFKVKTQKEFAVVSLIFSTTFANLNGNFFLFFRSFNNNITK